MRRFEQANRYWEVTVLGRSVTMRWGEVGATPRVFDRLFPTEGEAEVFAERQVIAQQGRGYVEIEKPELVVERPEIVVERMRRFQWPNRFVEVSQEGVKVTVRGGKIVDGRDVADRDKLDVVHQSSVAAAAVVFEERCADQRHDGGVATDPEPTHVVRTNPALEAQCVASGDDPAPWHVYADWLIANGDARGEIAAYVLAGKTADAKRMIGTHLRDLCGTDTGKLAFEYRHGFATHCTITIDLDRDELLEEVTRMFLASPMARFVDSLRFGLAGIGEENDWAPTLHAVATSPRAPFVRALRFDHYETEQSELSWTPFGDFGDTWSMLPALEHVHIKSGAGGTLGSLSLPNLKTFIRESGGLAQTEIEAIVNAPWPRLEHLEIWFGRDTYGAEGSDFSLLPVLDGRRFPALKHLGVVNCEFGDNFLDRLLRSPILPGLVSLDLSKGVLSTGATETIVRNADKLRHLASIDLRENFFSADELEQIRVVLGNVVSGTQRESDDDMDRVAAVGE